MKQILILPVHSSADVITNSSSELFVCNTEKTKEEIMEMLDLLSGITGHHGVGDSAVYQGVEGFKQILDRLGSYADGALYSMVSKFVPWQEMSGLHIPRFDSNVYYNLRRGEDEEWDVYYARQDKMRTDHENEVKAWIDANEELLAKHVGTITVIESEDDNSIPYDLFDLLETRLRAVRFHLG